MKSLTYHLALEHMKHCWYSFTYVVSVLTFQDTPRLIIVEVLTHSTA